MVDEERFTQSQEDGELPFQSKKTARWEKQASKQGSLQLKVLMVYYQASLLYLSNFVEPYQLFSQLKVFIFLPTKFRKKAEMLFGSTRIYDEEEKGN